MIDQAKVTSGFDVEFLMGEEFIQYFLICSMETGSIPWWSLSSGVDEKGSLFHRATITHPPSELQQRRLYPVNPDFVGNEHPFQSIVSTVYSNKGTEFRVTILPDDVAGADIRLRLFPSVIDFLVQPPKVLAENFLHADLDIDFDIVFNTREDGLLDNIGLQLELVDVSGPLIDIAVAFGATKESILRDMIEEIDRRVPFAVSGAVAYNASKFASFWKMKTGQKLSVFISILPCKTVRSLLHFCPTAATSALRRIFWSPARRWHLHFDRYLFQTG